MRKFDDLSEQDKILFNIRHQVKNLMPFEKPCGCCSKDYVLGYNDSRNEIIGAFDLLLNVHVLGEIKI